MSYNQRPSQSKSDSRVNQALKNDTNSKIESNNKKLSQINTISIPIRNPYKRRNEQNQIKDNKRYNKTNINNIELSEENNSRKDMKNISFYASKKNGANHNEKFLEEKKGNNIIININKDRDNNNKSSKEEKEVIKYNKINDKNNPENINNKINNNINKKDINNLINDNGNKFLLNFNSKKIISDKNAETIKTPRLNEKSNNTTSYFNKYSQKTTIVISKRSKINNPIKNMETEPNKTRNKYNYNNNLNKNKSPSSGLNILNSHNKLEKHIPIRSNISLKHYNIHEPNEEINQNKNKSSNHLLGRNITKEKAGSLVKNTNINLNTETISNKNKTNINDRNINTIPTISHRKNSLKNKILNQEINNNNNNSNKNTKKYSSFSYVQRIEEIKEKELSDDDNKNKNLIIIPRKEEKVYTSKKPPIIDNNIQNSNENKNLAFSSINSSNKVKNIISKENDKNNLNGSNKKEVNNNYNNNSITYIKTSSSKKEKLSQNENINSSKDLKFSEFIPKPQNLNNYYTQPDNDIKEIKNYSSVIKSTVITDINAKNANNNKEDILIENNIKYIKEESKVDQVDDKKINGGKNITPVKEINKLESYIKDDININKDFNISSSKNSLISTQKLEKKIKDLELKLDDLNNNISPFLGSTEIEEQEQNNNVKYSILDNPGLSDITKAYLSSYLEDSSPKLELSDFSRAYFFGLDDYNIYNERPALSGLTQEFLMENDNDMDKNEEIKEIKEEGKI